MPAITTDIDLCGKECHQPDLLVARMQAQEIVEIARSFFRASCQSNALQYFLRRRAPTGGSVPTFEFLPAER